MAPRLSNPRKRNDPPAASAPPIGHNSKAHEEADRIQLISIVSKLSEAEDEIEKAKAPLAAAQAARKKIIGLGKTAGFTAKELTDRLEEMKRPTRVMHEQAQREAKQRRWLGILDDEQGELILGDKVPADAKDEAHWKGEGYKAGLRQMSSTPPTECPERLVQAFMKEHERGLKEVLEANVPGGARLSVRDQAAQDFAQDNAPEPGSPEALAAERKAVAKAKDSLNKMGSGEPGEDEKPDAGEVV